LDQYCQHKNIVRLECTFQDENTLYFLMEFADKGPLTKLLKVAKHLPIETSRYIIAEIILALEHLHKEDISHRDLKPDNILLDKDYHIKICDFGEAKVISKINKEAIQREYEEMQSLLKKENQKDEEESDEPLELDI